MINSARHWIEGTDKTRGRENQKCVSGTWTGLHGVYTVKVKDLFTELWETIINYSAEKPIEHDFPQHLLAFEKDKCIKDNCQ